MRKTLLVLICFLFLARIAYSAIVEVGVAESLEGNISSIIYDNTTNLVKFSIEFYNTGSIPYMARIRIEVFNESDIVFSGWGKENEFMSGDKKISDIYWYTNETGEYSTKLKAYFGNDIKEYKNFGFSITNTAEAENVFEIKNFRTYENYVIFDVQSREDAKDVIVMPKQYTPGWIFEQTEIDEIPANTSKMVVLNYYSTVWRPSNVTFEIVSDKGNYYTEETVKMSKDEGLIGFLYYVVDNLRMTFYK